MASENYLRTIEAAAKAGGSPPTATKDSVKCPHCLVVVRRPSNSWQTVAVEPNNGPEVVVEAFPCANCGRPVVAILLGSGSYANPTGRPLAMSTDTVRWVVYPRGVSRPVSSHVLKSLADDYQEAAAVLDMSPKASAALSRRCLQNTVRLITNIKKKTLQAEIDELVDRGLVSGSLGAELQALRNIGNFAAHPMEDTTTGLIADVEPGEAEWTLEIIDRLFDELIVQPAEIATRKASLNAKLTAMGKPTIP